MGVCISKLSNTAVDVSPATSSSSDVLPPRLQSPHRARRSPPDGFPAGRAPRQAPVGGVGPARVLQPVPVPARGASVGAAAAALARQATDPAHPKYLDLSAAMCWDAVKLCAVAVLAVKRNVDAQQGLVSHADALVVDRDAVQSLPAGLVVGFFDEQRLVHAMLTVGKGYACGTKNDCIGLGHAVGWEALDLRGLRWDGHGGITAPGMLTPERTLHVRARPLETASAAVGR